MLKDGHNPHLPEAEPTHPHSGCRVRRANRDGVDSPRPQKHTVREGGRLQEPRDQAPWGKFHKKDRKSRGIPKARKGLPGGLNWLVPWRMRPF